MKENQFSNPFAVVVGQTYFVKEGILPMYPTGDPMEGNSVMVQCSNHSKCNRMSCMGMIPHSSEECADVCMGGACPYVPGFISPCVPVDEIPVQDVLPLEVK